jgi:hypothetical protein
MTQTAAQASKVLDAQFPWLRGAEKLRASGSPQPSGTNLQAAVENRVGRHAALVLEGSGAAADSGEVVGSIGEVNGDPLAPPSGVHWPWP